MLFIFNFLFCTQVLNPGSLIVLELVLHVLINFHQQLPFDWIQYVQGALGSPLVQIDIPLDEPIIVRAPLYFERLFNTLAKYDKRLVVYKAMKRNNIDCTGANI